MCGLAAKGQEVWHYELFLDAIRSRGDTSTIVYVDSSMFLGHTFSELTHHGIITGYRDLRGGAKISMQFSQAELKELDSKILSQNRIRWPDNMFPGSLRLQQDCILTFIHDRATPEFRRNQVYRPYYYFSVPVTTRNNNVAVFRLVPMIRPVAGNDLIFIYVRESSGWKRRMTFWAGAW